MLCGETDAVRVRALAVVVWIVLVACCIWADGHRLCRTYYEESYGENPAVPEYGYYGAPGIYLGYGGFGAGRGPLDDSEGR